MQNIAFFMFDGFELLDVTGPQSVFFNVQRIESNSYNTFCFSYDGSKVKSETGIQVIPDYSLSNIPSIDVLIIPGGIGSRQYELPMEASERLKCLIKNVKTVITVCTGVFWLSRLNLLEDQKVTTHWDFCGLLKQQHPLLQVEEDVLYVCDQGWSEHQLLWSSAGVSAGIDLALHLVALRHGSLVALEVARYLVVYMRRDGGQRQLSQSIRHELNDRQWASLSKWISNNLGHSLTVACIAEQLHLSERQFFRACQKRFGITPAQWLEQMRMEQARLQLLELPAEFVLLKKLANNLGYSHYPSFTRAFKRHYGMSPICYQQNFVGKLSD